MVHISYTSIQVKEYFALVVCQEQFKEKLSQLIFRKERNLYKHTMAYTRHDINVKSFIKILLEIDVEIV